MQSPATSPAVALPEMEPATTAPGVTPAGAAACHHCGLACRDTRFESGGKCFCCEGCRTVFELLSENGLTDFYQLADAAGVRVRPPAAGQFAYLDEASVRQRLLDFAGDRQCRVTFRAPAIHCVACVWLLENLFRFNPGIGQATVNFARREVAVSFDPAKVKLSEIAALMTSLGYEPELKFADVSERAASPISRRLWLQLGIAGFVFGNTMLFSIATYLGLDAFHGAAFHKLFGWLSLLLSLPVFFYSAADYWRAAWVSIRRRLLTIDVPIAAGIVALYVQSVYEVVSGTGGGYFDSLAGLLFFLLCGKLFQLKTYDRLSFDRDYKSFFPLSVTRKRGAEEARVALSQLAVGDHLVLRNGELIPADARLIAGPAVIDYSFVTGEAEPLEKRPEDYLYAGGRQIGGAIEVELVKPVSQSYLTSLWSQEAFRKDKGDTLDNLTNRYSQRFTKIVVAIAIGAAAYWAWVLPAVAVKAFASVLIVACPCALALAAPFALGTALRVLERRQVYLKNAHVLEALARVDAVVFDKTGTLTAAGAGAVTFQGAPLSEAEERWFYSMTRHSTHPYAVRLGEAIAREHFPEHVRSFVETAGCGMEATVAGHEIWMGSAAWLQSRGAHVLPLIGVTGGTVHLAVDGKYRGVYVLTSAVRPQTDLLLASLAPHYRLNLLSGDHEKERVRFAGLFRRDADLHFNQSPLDKLAFIREQQRGGRTVMMVGDGLNDAGALQQSDVGVAVVETAGAFSPASDIIMNADRVPQLDRILKFAHSTVRIVRWSFLISGLYNVIGISIAAAGLLTPVVCAILMPLSSVTVVAFACGFTEWRGRQLFKTS